MKLGRAMTITINGTILPAQLCERCECRIYDVDIASAMANHAAQHAARDAVLAAVDYSPKWTKPKKWAKGKRAKKVLPPEQAQQRREAVRKYQRDYYHTVRKNKLQKGWR